jgi:hypothetical protein
MSFNPNTNLGSWKVNFALGFCQPNHDGVDSRLFGKADADPKFPVTIHIDRSVTAIRIGMTNGQSRVESFFWLGHAIWTRFAQPIDFWWRRQRLVVELSTRENLLPREQRAAQQDRGLRFCLSRDWINRNVSRDIELIHPDTVTLQGDPKANVSVPRKENRLAMAVIGRDFFDHRLVHVLNDLQNTLRGDRFYVISRRTIVLHCGSSAGEGIAMVRLATVGSPVTKKTPTSHIGRVLARNFARQVVEFELSETRAGTLFINHFEQQFASQREIILVESPALDRRLAAAEHAQAQHQRRGRLKKPTASDEVVIGTHGNLDASHGLIFHLGDNNGRRDRLMHRAFVRDLLKTGKLVFG